MIQTDICVSAAQNLKETSKTTVQSVSVMSMDSLGSRLKIENYQNLTDTYPPLTSGFLHVCLPLFHSFLYAFCFLLLYRLKPSRAQSYIEKVFAIYKNGEIEMNTLFKTLYLSDGTVERIFNPELDFRSLILDRLGKDAADLFDEIIELSNEDAIIKYEKENNIT